MDLVLVIMSRLFLMPWLPMPLSRKPWKGKWSGPRAGAEFTWKDGKVAHVRQLKGAHIGQLKGAHIGHLDHTRYISVHHRPLLLKAH